MVSKKEKTAAELMAELQHDSGFLARQAEIERKRTARSVQVKILEAPILEELRAMGIRLDSLNELVHHCAPLSTDLVGFCLRWLQLSKDEGFQEFFVRALAASEAPFDGKRLIELFEQTKSEGLRWAIANTIAEARPFNVIDWVLSVVKDPAYGISRQMLMIALARLAPKEVANPLLCSLYDQLPGHVAMALAESGGKQELDFLKSKLEESKGWIKKDIKRAIRLITKRGNL